MKKVAVFCLESINNAGEDILGSCVEYLILRSAVDADVQRYQFMPLMSELKQYSLIRKIVSKILLDLSSKMPVSSLKYMVRNLGYRVRFQAYYDSIIRESDSVLTAIGAYKFSTQDFSYMYHLMARSAVKYGKPVMVNAVSVAKPDVNDWRFAQLQRTLNLGSVKSFTTRDGQYGVSRLKQHYRPKPSLHIEAVGDPALWIRDCYEITPPHERSNILGINVIRGRIYQAYGGNVSEEDLLCVYRDLILEITKRGYEWVLFCNGMYEDYEFGKKLVAFMSLSPDKLMPPITDGKTLALTINTFKAVFAARFHACLTSYALGVPFVGLLWDNKLDFFSQTMHLEKFFVSEAELEGNLIIDKLEDAMNYQCDNSFLEDYRIKTFETVDAFIKNN